MRTPLAVLLLATSGCLAMPGHAYRETATTAAGESYEPIVDNPVVATADQPRSTFAIDVDTASMSNVRRFLEDGQLPPADAVRVEEMINYFDYRYPDPDGDAPLAVTTALAPSPFHHGDQLLRIGIQGKRMAATATPPLNLVFLIDTSGSMEDADKLPLLKQALGLLVARLRPEDRVGIVTYAGTAGVALEPTGGDHQDQILDAIAGLAAGGSTAGAGGIVAAYDLARAHYDPRAINRVLLATDGDFNVGVTDEDALVRLIEKERDSGIALTVLGCGTGNLADSRMEKLADHGNGNYAYLDSLAEARKVLVEQAGGTLVTIADDVKVQVELDPAQVARYRLIGYEDRVMANQDFRNDAKDAGELGAGHTVTALYELTPAAHAVPGAKVATVRLRWKKPGDTVAQETAIDAAGGAPTLAAASDDVRFAAAVAGFGMLLRGKELAGDLDWRGVRDLARDAAGDDGRRLALVSLIETAARLSGADVGPARAR